MVFVRTSRVEIVNDACGSFALASCTPSKFWWKTLRTRFKRRHSTGCSAQSYSPVFQAHKRQKHQKRGNGILQTLDDEGAARNCDQDSDTKNIGQREEVKFQRQLLDFWSYDPAKPKMGDENNDPHIIHAGHGRTVHKEEGALRRVDREQNRNDHTQARNCKRAMRDAFRAWVWSLRFCSRST